MVLSDTHDDSSVITLLPNRSLTWAETRLFVLLICGTTLAVGLFWAVAGLWAILPFSGLEAGLVAWVMYRVCQATYQRQVITFTPGTVRVQFGTRYPKRTWELDRERTSLSVIEARHHLEAPRLRISDPHHSIELGGFLNREDKKTALTALKQAGLYVRRINAEGQVRL